MKNLYLNTWLRNFPPLNSKLTKEDMEVLNQINPLEYIDFNLTKDSEVISIIQEHKPQAWKWVRLYPELKNLSAEDYAILDHISTTEFIFDVTKEDLLRIIELRKQKLKKQKDISETEARRRYFEDHKAEIAAEEKMRRRIPKVTMPFCFLGLSFISSGVVAITQNAPINAKALGIAGLAMVLIPTLISSVHLKYLDKHTAIPKPLYPVDDKLDFTSISLICCYFIGLMGLATALGTLFTWDLFGWYIAEKQLITGLAIAGGSVLLFLLLAIIAPTSKE